MPESRSMSPARRQGFLALNASATPFWLAMIVAPRSRVTRWLMERAAPGLWLGLGGAYDALLVAGMIERGEVLDFSDPDAVRQALGDEPDLFLAGWAHYIAFDLFVGRWIWEDALERGRSARLALALTLLAGPAGLSLYLVQRRA